MSCIAKLAMISLQRRSRYRRHGPAWGLNGGSSLPASIARIGVFTISDDMVLPLATSCTTGYHIVEVAANPSGRQRVEGIGKCPSPLPHRCHRTIAAPDPFVADLEPISQAACCPMTMDCEPPSVTQPRPGVLHVTRVDVCHAHPTGLVFRGRASPQEMASGGNGG